MCLYATLVVVIVDTRSDIVLPCLFYRKCVNQKPISMTMNIITCVDVWQCQISPNIVNVITYHKLSNIVNVITTYNDCKKLATVFLMSLNLTL